MARQFHPTTLQILRMLNKHPAGLTAKELFKGTGVKTAYKDFYNILFRLADLGYIAKNKTKGSDLTTTITEEGKKLLNRKEPEKDGVWKMVIFDIPEKQKKVRQVLRAKLKELHFQKWQNSIWISPYALDAEIEEEFKELGKRFFVRLIKTTEINETGDLEKLFNNS